MRRQLERYYPPEDSCLRALSDALQVRDGFIIDDEDEEDVRQERRRKNKKKRRREREEEQAVLDDDDLDLIGAANPEWEHKAPSQVCLACDYTCRS